MHSLGLADSFFLTAHSSSYYFSIRFFASSHLCLSIDRSYRLFNFDCLFRQYVNEW